jgi:hypothetical protein
LEGTLQALVTIDTEISPVEIRTPALLEANIQRRIWGRVKGGESGIDYQAGSLNRVGLKGVFFVESLCGSVIDKSLLRDWVAVLQEQDQEVQLHVHAEWAQYLGIDPQPGLTGFNLAHYGRDEQTRLIGMALENLVAAGAREVCAFRAGNYGANEDTLSALSELGIAYDASYNQLYIDSECALTPVSRYNTPFRRNGCGVVPVTNFVDGIGRGRHAQLCACSAGEMQTAIGNALNANLSSFVVVSHSFELLKPGKAKSSRINLVRWKSLLRFLSETKDSMRVVGFCDLNAGFFDRKNASDGLSVPLSKTLGRLAGQIADRVL